MPDQILVLRETARTGPGPGNGGGVVLPPGSKLGTYGDSLSGRTGWQPTVCQYFDIPWAGGGLGSSTAAWTTSSGNTSANFGSSDARLNPFLTNVAANINTIWFGANDWTNINQNKPPNTPQITVGTEAEFSKPAASKDRMTWAGAISYMIQRFYTVIPTGLHILIAPSNMRYVVNDQDFLEMIRLCEAAALFHGCPIINLARDAGITEWNRTSFMSDNVHMDPPPPLGIGDANGARGALRVANLIIDKIRTYFSVSDLITPAIAPLAQQYEEEPSTAWARERERAEAGGV